MGCRLWIAQLVVVGMLVAGSSGCSGHYCGDPGVECAGSTPAMNLTEMAHEVEQWPVPPYNGHFRSVRCTYLGNDVACGGVIVFEGKRNRSVAAFKDPNGAGRGKLIPICSQGRLGLKPRFNPFCAM